MLNLRGERERDAERKITVYKMSVQQFRGRDLLYLIFCLLLLREVLYSFPHFLQVTLVKIEVPFWAGKKVREELVAV